MRCTLRRILDSAATLTVVLKSGLRAVALAARASGSPSCSSHSIKKLRTELVGPIEWMLPFLKKGADLVGRHFFFSFVGNAAYKLVKAMPGNEPRAVTAQIAINDWILAAARGVSGIRASNMWPRVSRPAGPKRMKLGEKTLPHRQLKIRARARRLYIPIASKRNPAISNARTRRTQCARRASNK